MPAAEAILKVVREWIVKADQDLAAAAHILKLGKAAPVDIICFHAQQCVEKYLKAILVYRSLPFPKSHNIRVLMGLVPRRSRPTLADVLQDRLTEYASAARYPESGLDISLTAARKAVTLARRVRREVRRKLPRRALPKKKK
ncbi:MAG TPA: HEPN domain-containing protein [Gemmataceae bacterium]|nr:HEPN domain-containing protein [Gemmataceae bacterium]